MSASRMGVRLRGTRYLLTVELGRDASGRRRRHCASFATETEAIAAEKVVLAKRALGQWQDPTKITVSAYLDRWLEYMEPRVAPATFVRYSGQVKEIKKSLGRHRLGKLSALHITVFEAGLYRRGLSDSTVRKYRMIEQGALRMAAQWDLIAKSPVDKLDSITEHNPEVRWLTASEQIALLTAAKSGFKGRESRLYVLILLALATGMRRGELLALRWADVDFKGCKVSMRRSLQWKPGGYQYRVHGKNGSRVVDLPPSMLPVLLAYRERRARELALCGTSSALIFCDNEGEPWNLDGVRSGFRYLVDRAGLSKGIHFHCLRHTHATEALEDGTHPKIVAERIGDSVQMTMKTYSHAVPSLQTKAAEKTDLRMRGLLGGDAAS